MAIEAGAIVEQPREEPHGGVLYVVGTPIGNRGDLSPRARRVLEQIDVIACEDTRHSGQLLQGLSGHGRLVSFHRHNRQQRQPQLLAVLASGQGLALISDAGMPGISDPGEELVAAARQAGHGVICIPGPTAFVMALVGSGLPCGRFVFEGFLPARPGARRQRLQYMAAESRTMVFYEAPHRLLALVKDLLELWGDRPLQVGRELTKRHEEFVGPTTATALEHFRDQPPRGECCVVVGGCPAPATLPWDGDALAAQLQRLVRQEGLSHSQAARVLAQRSGHSRQRLYALLLQRRHGGEQGAGP
ncbi:rRNA small subunit methyltransferase I [Candidatus Synechococcus spongiarum]|uniref:Ribosomal RNA small subunit methyltransferase I n=2 Tax=Candidatus Synechococcus spongiarum TaxID=431041 RepID=A0A165B0V5_9SYNE|nr:rRNA small subunit methyltransferase I [Candidatus Synechococcus spongiarum]